MMVTRWHQGWVAFDPEESASWHVTEVAGTGPQPSLPAEQGHCMHLRLTFATLAALIATPALADWQDTLDAARGQTVYWNAWGGDARTNAFIAWVGDRTEALYDVSIEHVRLSDTAEALARVISERAAGRDDDGSVDLIWINGPNFLAMKEQDLLYGPFVADLPNAAYVDLSPGAPATLDFTVPVEGMESPWRLARFVFTHDSARMETPPLSMAGFVDWAAANPGRMTHPDPSNFMGATFLKQALIELAPDPEVLLAPATDARFAEQTAPLWAWYDALRPNLWRGGETFPENESLQQQLLNDGEVDIAMSFDPASTAAAIAQASCQRRRASSCPRAGPSATSVSSPSRTMPPMPRARRSSRMSCSIPRFRRGCRTSRCWVPSRCSTPPGSTTQPAPPSTRCRARPPCPRWKSLARPCRSHTPAG